MGKSDKAKSDKPKLYVKVQRAHDLRNMEPRLQLLTFERLEDVKIMMLSEGCESM